MIRNFIHLLSNRAAACVIIIAGLMILFSLNAIAEIQWLSKDEEDINRGDKVLAGVLYMTLGVLVLGTAFFDPELFRNMLDAALNLVKF